MKFLYCLLFLTLFLTGCKSLKKPVDLSPRTIKSPIVRPIQTNYLSKEILLISPSKTNVIKQSVSPTNGKINLELKIVSEGSTNKVWIMEEKTEIITNNFLYLYFGSVLLILAGWAFWSKKPKKK